MEGTGKTGGISGQDDSSESDGETEPARAFHRRISTNKEIKSSVSREFFYILKADPATRLVSLSVLSMCVDSGRYHCMTIDNMLVL